MTDKIKMLGMLDIKGDEQTRRVYSTDGITPTLNTMQGGNRQPKIMIRQDTHGLTVFENEYRIRKLTPRECWRLMGFTDEDFNKASECNSNSQLYKQAGNSIVVNCLEEIFKQLF